jgi:HK97 family phage major capsid protein
MSSVLIDNLRARRELVWKQAKTLADHAANENRNFTNEEQSAFEVFSDELDKYDERIKELATKERRDVDTANAVASISGRRSSNPELRSFLRGDPGAPRVFDVAPSGTDFRSLTKLTAAAGANTVPTSFYDQLVQHLVDTAQLLGQVTVLTTASGESLQIPKTTAHSTAAIVTEGGTIGTSDPAFGQVTLGAFKYGVLIQVSRELVDDTGVDLEGYLARETGRALGNAFGAHLVVGTGTTQPRGITLDSTLGLTGAATAPTPDNLADLYFSVIAPYRTANTARWVMNSTTWQAIRKLKEGGTNNYFVGSLAEVGTPVLFGAPVVLDPSMPAYGAAAKAIIFGDLSAYYARVVGGVRFERSDDFAFSSDLVTYRALLRGDGALVDSSGAVKHMLGA